MITITCWIFPLPVWDAAGADEQAAASNEIRPATAADWRGRPRALIRPQAPMGTHQAPTVLQAPRVGSVATANGAVLSWSLAKRRTPPPAGSGPHGSVP